MKGRKKEPVKKAIKVLCSFFLLIFCFVCFAYCCCCFTHKSTHKENTQGAPPPLLRIHLFFTFLAFYILFNKIREVGGEGPLQKKVMSLGFYIFFHTKLLIYGIAHLLYLPHIACLKM